MITWLPRAAFEPVAQRAAQKRPRLVQHHDQLAQVLLQPPHHGHGLRGRPRADDDQQLLDVRPGVAEHDFHGLSQRARSRS